MSRATIGEAQNMAAQRNANHQLQQFQDMFGTLGSGQNLGNPFLDRQIAAYEMQAQDPQLFNREMVKLLSGQISQLESPFGPGGTGGLIGNQRLGSRNARRGGGSGSVGFFGPDVAVTTGTEPLMGMLNTPPVSGGLGVPNVSTGMGSLQMIPNKLNPFG